ncbi:MAG TPA: phosphoribosylamine--glycine ligase [Candidatus Thermoplasmatota archaeon]|nr:phosphoribosylamine--glycine ligase [Candidatus Thermoplasmatota archaeon]
MATRVLLVGGGAREHAMAEAIVRSGGELHAILKNKNPGILGLAKAHAIMSETDCDAIVERALAWGCTLAVVGPEAPLEAGVSDALAEAGIPSASPSKKAAEIESSKEFMRKLLDEHTIPGRLQWRVFDNPRGLKTYIDRVGDVVVKPIGLTGGKGVKVMGEHLADSEEAAAYAKEILDTKFGGAKVLIEEKVTGEEFSVMAFCDGNVAVPMPAVQDHKRAYEGDRGHNTGGMGTYTGENGLLPFLTKHDYEEAALIVQKILDALKAEGRAYTGAIYGQFMLTADGPRVIEVNARFGDPEAMNALHLLDSNYIDLLTAMVEGSLSKKKVTFRKEATVCKYVVPEGYGTAQSKAGVEVKIDREAVEKAGAKIYYAAVNEDAGRITTTTSRAIGVVASGPTIDAANEKVEAALKHITGDGLFVRHDIGTKDLVQRRVQHMKKLRGN